MNEVTRKIGGTQISRIFGLSRWGGPMDAYLVLTGIVEDEVAGEPAFWGKEAQPAILKRYIKETGRNMVICDQTFQHPEYEFITFTPDCLTENFTLWPQSPHIVELKETTIRGNYGIPGTDEVSDETALQCQLYMGCCGAKTCDVAVHFLRPRHEFAIYHLEFNQEIFDNIIQVAKDFWLNHVIPKVPPPLDESEGSKKLLNYLYPRDTQDLFAATPEIEQLAREIHGWEAARDYGVKNLTLAQNQMKEIIGDHAGVVTSLGKITWKKSKDREDVDWKAIAERLSERYDVDPKQWGDLIDSCTTTRPGSRVFRAWWKKSKED